MEHFSEHICTVGQRCLRVPELTIGGGCPAAPYVGDPPLGAVANAVVATPGRGNYPRQTMLNPFRDEFCAGPWSINSTSSVTYRSGRCL